MILISSVLSIQIDIENRYYKITHKDIHKDKENDKQTDRYKG